MTCDTGHWLSEGVSDPSPGSLEDFIFCWLLLGPFPEFSVAGGLRPSDSKDYQSQVLMNVWIFSVAALVPGFSSIQQGRFYCGVKDPDFGEAQMFFIWRKAALALPVLTFTSAPVPPYPPPRSCLSTMLHR